MLKLPPANHAERATVYSVMRAENTRSQRGALNQNDQLRTRVLFKRFPKDIRLQSLTADFFNTCPWLAALLMSEPSCVVGPKRVGAKEVQPIPCRSEEQLDSTEDVDVPGGVSGVLADFGRAEFSTSYLQNPITNVAEQQQLALRSLFPEISIPTAMKFLRINSFTVTDFPSEVSSMDLYVFTDRPICEPIHKKLNQPDTIFLPLVHTLKSREFAPRLIAILYEIDCPVERVPFALGQFHPGNEPSTFFWSRYNPTVSLMQNIRNGQPLEIGSSQICVDIVTSPDPARTAKLIAFDRDLPTPLLTVIDVTVVLGKTKMKLPNALLGCCFALRASDKDPPVASVLTSTVDAHDENYFPEPVTFTLSPTTDRTLSLDISVFLTKQRRQELLFMATCPLVKSSDIVTLRPEKRGKLLNSAAAAESTISFRYFYPTICHPPESFMATLVAGSRPMDMTNPSYLELLPYALLNQLNFLPDQANRLSLATVVNFVPWTIPNAELDLLKWIDEWFGCDEAFLQSYIQKLGESLLDIQMHPKLFFAILYKGLVINRAIERVPFLDFLLRCAETTCGPHIHDATSEFILKVCLFFQTSVLSRDIYRFLVKLDINQRLESYRILWTELSFIVQALKFDGPASFAFDKPFSIYIPIFSLYFSTIYQVFLVNSPKQVRLALKTITALFTTLESYADEALSQLLVQRLFPMLSILFIFWDSIWHHVTEKSMIGPPFLFLIGKCNGEQFIHYWRLLSQDNQLRFLDKLAWLAELTTVNEIASRSVGMSELPLLCLQEITWRIAWLFTHFHGKVQHAKNAWRITTTLLCMLTARNQVEAAFRILFKALTFIADWGSLLFQQKNSLIVDIMSAIVPLTQRKLGEARICAIAFIEWLITLEVTFHTHFERCNYALMFAATTCFCECSSFIPFHPYITHELSTVRELITKLSNARSNTPLVESQLKIYFDLSQYYSKFASIRAQLYKHIANVSSANGDYCSALVAQWRFCALVAEVFGLKGQTVDGVPSQGFNNFPFIYDEPPLDATALESADGYLVMEGPIFTEHTLSVALQEVLKLVRDSGICWIVRNMTAYLFDFLEAHREFPVLVLLYGDMINICQDLESAEPPKMEFFRVFVSDDAVPKVGFREVIHVSSRPVCRRIWADEGKRPPKMIDELKTSLKALDIVVVDSENPLEDPGEKIAQFTRVHGHSTHSVRLLKESKFFVDVITAPESGWDENFAQRVLYETQFPLPHLVPTVNVRNLEVTHFTRANYYILKLEAFRDKFKGLLKLVRDVCPPKKLIERWPDCPLQINTHPILLKIGKIADATPEDPIFYFVAQEHLTAGIRQSDVPAPLKTLSDEVWKLLTESVRFIHDIQAGRAKNPPTIPGDEALVQKYATIFAVNLEEVAQAEREKRMKRVVHESWQ